MAYAFTCELCRNPFSTALQEVHHKIPRIIGGADSKENTIDLCANCHTFLHRLARTLKKNSVLANDELTRYFPNDLKKRERALELAKTIFLAREQRKKEYVQVNLQLPLWLDQQLKDRAKASKIKGGRDAYILHLLEKHCRQY